jgi:hypothetical protein
MAPSSGHLLRGRSPEGKLWDHGGFVLFLSVERAPKCLCSLSVSFSVQFGFFFFFFFNFLYVESRAS